MYTGGVSACTMICYPLFFAAAAAIDDDVVRYFIIRISSLHALLFYRYVCLFGCLCVCCVCAVSEPTAVIYYCTPYLLYPQ